MNLICKLYLTFKNLYTGIRSNAMEKMKLAELCSEGAGKRWEIGKEKQERGIVMGGNERK